MRLFAHSRSSELKADLLMLVLHNILVGSSHQTISGSKVLKVFSYVLEVMFQVD